MYDLPPGANLTHKAEDGGHPEPGFRKISVDLAGPYLMKIDVRRRSGRKDDGRVKIWVSVFACSMSSAVKLYICRDHLEEGFSSSMDTTRV